MVTTSLMQLKYVIYFCIKLNRRKASTKFDKILYTDQLLVIRTCIDFPLSQSISKQNFR